MNAEEIVGMLLEADGPLHIYALIDEASVHLPRRGRLWMASYRNGSGRQYWRSTGETDRRAALVIAQELERAARRERGDQANLTADPLVRVRWGTGKGTIGLTQKEVALLMGMSERGVRAVERRKSA